MEKGTTRRTENEPSQRQKVKRIKSVELTDRDLKVLEFILDMKFARVSDVFEKFFKENIDGSPAASDSWTKKRLFQLEQAKFLRSQYSYLGSEKYFTTTLKAYHTLANVYPEKSLTKPLKGIDQRTLTHDRLVVESRLVLERTRDVDNWISDRRLKSHMASVFGLSQKYIPDAIYRLPNGDQVAFELEIAQKSKSRLRDKLEKYVRLIRERRNDPLSIKKVHYLCFKRSIFEILKREANLYGDLIQVEMSKVSGLSQGGLYL